MPPRRPGRWFVGEREGRIVAVDNREDARDKQTVLDLRAPHPGLAGLRPAQPGLSPRVRPAGLAQPGLLLHLVQPHRHAARGDPSSPTSATPAATACRASPSPTGRSPPTRPPSWCSSISRAATPTTRAAACSSTPTTASSTWRSATAATRSPRAAATSGSASTDDAQRIDRDLLSGLLRIDVDRRGGTISHPIRRQPRQRAHPGLLHPQRQPLAGPRRRAAGGVLRHRPAQPPPGQLRPGHPADLRRRRRRPPHRGGERRRARRQLPVELPRGERAHPLPPAGAVRGRRARPAVHLHPPDLGLGDRRPGLPGPAPSPS